MFQQGQPVAMFYSGDIQRDYERIRAAGAEFKMHPIEVTGSTIAQVNDTSGNIDPDHAPGPLERLRGSPWTRICRISIGPRFTRRSSAFAPVFGSTATTLVTSCAGITHASGACCRRRAIPQPTVPAWPQFLRGCIQYRESLDRQLPNAPRTEDEFQGRA